MGYKEIYFFDQMISWYVGLILGFLILISSFVSKAEQLNIRTCDIVSSSEKLKEGRLSDYWAQELIGSDLLREEVEAVPALRGKPSIEIVDDFMSGHNHDSHGNLVSNLILDEGLHAVLPELGRDGVSENNIRDLDYLGLHHPSFINISLGGLRTLF